MNDIVVFEIFGIFVGDKIACTEYLVGCIGSNAHFAVVGANDTGSWFACRASCNCCLSCGNWCAPFQKTFVIIADIKCGFTNSTGLDGEWQWCFVNSHFGTGVGCCCDYGRQFWCIAPTVNGFDGDVVGCQWWQAVKLKGDGVARFVKFGVNGNRGNCREVALGSECFCAIIYHVVVYIVVAWRRNNPFKSYIVLSGESCNRFHRRGGSAVAH